MTEARIKGELLLSAATLIWNTPEEFVDFVVEQIEEETYWYGDEDSLGAKTERLLRKRLKHRKQDGVTK